MKPLVKPYGDPSSRIAFVGEAPGFHEERLGEPFVGQSGALLTRLMQSAGISRTSSYITNVVKERPPNNDISTFIKLKPQSGSADATPKYLEYEKLLYHELSQCRANVIVAVGGVALWALCRKVGIMKWRGSILEMVGPVVQKVIPIIHPAAALRNNALTYVIFADLKRVAEEAESRSISRIERELISTPSYLEILAYLEWLYCHTTKVAYDIEVVNEELYCMSFAESPLRGICIPFMKGGQDYFNPTQEATIMRAVARVLEASHITKLGTNLAFDNSFMFMRYGIRVTKSDDVMVAQGIAYPDLPKSLAFITSFYTKEPYYKDDFKKWSNKAASDDSFRIYNIRDSVIPLEAEPKIHFVISKQGNDETYESQVALIEPLTYMQARGLRINVEGLRAAAKEAETRELELEEQLCSMVGYQLNPRSPDQLKEHFYGKLKLPPYKSRQTKAITTDAIAMKRIARKGIPEASVILQIRRVRKLRSTYYEMKFDSDGRLRSAFNPIGTKTGRLSSSKNIFGLGGNEQNLPPEFLQFVIADEGYDLYVVDLAQAENRLVAYIAPEPNMIRAFENGIDLHKQTASLIFAKPISEISDEIGSCPIGGGIYSERFWGKKTNHSLNYDLGYRAFALITEILDSEAKFIVERYHASYPGVRQYHAWIRALLRDTRTITNLFGRSRVFLGSDEEIAKDAYAQIPQSTVADVINRRGIIPLYYDSCFRPVDLLSQVHDSIVFQLPHSSPVEDRASILLSLKTLLEGQLEFRGREFSIPADFKVGTSLAKKKMEDIKLNDYSTVEGLAEHLRTIYRKFGTSALLPPVDGYLSDLSSDEEEMSSSLGDAEDLPEHVYSAGGSEWEM